VHILPALDDIAKMKSDPQENPLIFYQGCVPIAEFLLDLDCASRSIERTGKLNKKRITYGLDLLSVMDPEDRT
jgi:hypothetical protein